MRGGGVLVVGLLAGCHIQDLDLTGKACPCPSGWTCDLATNTCTTNPTGSGDAAIDGMRDGAMPSAFKYRRRITIHNVSTMPLPASFTIRLPMTGVLGSLVAAGKVSADFSDLRVIGDGALGERDRIIDPPAGPGPAALSFSLAAPIDPGATSTAYALYYGSATVGTAPANGAAVFTLYDDFTTGISTSVWLKNDTASVTGGQLILHANHIDGLTTNANVDKLPIISAVELVATVVDPNSNPTVQPEGTLYYWFGYQHTGDFTANDPWILWIARGKNGMGVEQKSPTGCEAGCAPTPGAQDNRPHYYAIERDPAETRFYYDVLAPQAIAVTNSADYSPIVRNFLATSDVQIDYLRARARVSPDPAISVAAEETL